jgi:sugar phosphate permease
MQALQSLLFWQSFGAYAALWMADFGWSRTTISWIASLQRTESGLLGPIHGWWLQRSSPRRVYVIGVLLMGAGMIGLALARDLGQFIALYLIASIGSSLCGMLTLMTVLVNWFERHRAKAMAGLQLGLTLGALAVPLVAWALVAFGWRPVTAVSGLIVVIVGLPMARLLHTDPESVGLRPDGAPADDAAPADEGATATAPAPRRPPLATAALRTRAFWCISGGHATAMATMSGVSVHFVVYVNEVLGFSITTAAAMVSVMTAAAVVGQIAGGALGDRVQKRWLAAAGMLAHAFAMALLIGASEPVAVLVAAVSHGLGWGVRGPLMGPMRADYFGRSAFASVMGLSSLVVMVGSVTGPLLIGGVADATGSYGGGFAVLAAVALAGTFSFMAAGAPRPAAA